MVKVPTVKFNNGLTCPILGLGTWLSKPGEVTEAVKVAIDAGYRHIDGAYVYENESEVGEAIRAKIKQGVVKREDLFITSKLWNTYHRREAVVPACKRTLANLGLDYVDLYLIHWPFGFKEGDILFPKSEDGSKTLYSEYDFVDTWKGMEECVKLGLVKSIGVSNFNSRQIEEILKVAEIKPVNNQVECHPLLNQEKLINFCKEKGITVTAYSPLGNPGRPSAKPGEEGILTNPKILDIAKKYNKSAAQILIRYQIERGIIVIPKSVSKPRIESNFDVLDFTLSSDDLSKINGLNNNKRLLGINWCTDHKHYPFHIEY